MSKLKGYTLVELVVATAVVSVLTLVMMNFMATRFADNAIKNARSDMQLQAQRAIDIITRDIKLSASVDSNNRWSDNYAPDSPTNNYSWVSDSDTLILAHPATNTNNDVLWQDAQGYVSYKDDYIFFVSNGTLYKRILPATVSGNRVSLTCPSGTANCNADIKLANNVDYFNVQYFATGSDAGPDPAPSRSVDVTLRLSKKVFGKTITEEKREHTTFRNQ